MIIGHEKQRKYFQNVLKNDLLGHAYLFSGQESVGKKKFATELAEELVGANIENSPNFKLIHPRKEDGETKIYIEDIRSLKRLFSFRGLEGEIRVVVIDDSHTMTSEAANAFLKILEEPPIGSLFILISSMPKLLPETVLSRCEEVKFFPVKEDEILRMVKRFNISKDDSEFLIKISSGRVGLINNLIEKDKLKDAKKSINDLRSILAADEFERMIYAKKIYESGIYQEFIDHWLHWVSAHLSVSEKNEKIVKDLLFLNQITSQPQYNHRLALENFLLNL